MVDDDALCDEGRGKDERHRGVGANTAATSISIPANLFTTDLVVERILSFLDVESLLLQARHVNSCCLRVSGNVLLQRLVAGDHLLQLRLWTKSYGCGLLLDLHDNENEHNVSHSCDLEHSCCNSVSLGLANRNGCSSYTTKDALVEEQVQSCIAHWEIGYRNTSFQEEGNDNSDDNVHGELDVNRIRSLLQKEEGSVEAKDEGEGCHGGLGGFAVQHAFTNLKHPSSQLRLSSPSQLPINVRTRSPELERCAACAINRYHVCPLAEHNLASKQQHLCLLEHALAICLAKVLPSQPIQHIRTMERAYHQPFATRTTTCGVEQGRLVERLQFTVSVPSKSKNNAEKQQEEALLEYRWEKEIGGASAAPPVRPSYWHALEYSSGGKAVGPSFLMATTKRPPPLPHLNENDNEDLFADSSEDDEPPAKKPCV